MIPDPITARNRANARKITGPKTSLGKAAAAGNARRHGMTARPDPEAVATWLGIITDNPDITPQDLTPQDDLGYRALALALAEARLASAERGMLIYMTVSSDDYAAMLQLDKATKFHDEVTAQRSGVMPAPRMMSATFSRVSQARVDATIDATHDWLMRRYLSEARSQRRKALRAWITARGEARP